MGCLQRLHREFRIAKVLYVNCYNCSFIVDFLTGLDPRSGFSFKRFFFIGFSLRYQIFVLHVYSFIIIALDLVFDICG